MIKCKISIWIVLALVLMAANACGKSSGIERLEKDLSDPDWEVRYNAVNELGKIGPEPDVIDALIKAIDDDNELVRSMALAGLGPMGNKASKAVPAIVDAYNDENFIVRQGAVLAIGSVGDSSEAVPFLIKALDDEEGTVRATTATLLGDFGSAASPALEKLRSLAKNDPWKNPSTGKYMVREWAKKAIEKIAGSE